MGCSSGRIAILIAQRFPKTQVYGVDIGVDAIEQAKRAAEKKSVKIATSMLQMFVTCQLIG